MSEIVTRHAADAMHACFVMARSCLGRIGRAEAWEASLVAHSGYVVGQLLRVDGCVARLTYGSPALALQDAAKNLGLLASAELSGRLLGPSGFGMFDLSGTNVTDLLQASRELQTACRRLAEGHDHRKYLLEDWMTPLPEEGPAARAPSGPRPEPARSPYGRPVTDPSSMFGRPPRPPAYRR